MAGIQQQRAGCVRLPAIKAYDMKPLVSIIIPYFNHGTHLFQATCSALRSYTGPKEILIINDGSTETNSVAYLNACADLSSDVRVISQDNRGLSAARNAGIDAAHGEYVQFLDSDDILLPSKIDFQLSQFAITSEISISLSGYLICDELADTFTFVGDSIGRFDFCLHDFKFFWERGMSIPIHCGLFKKAVFDEIRFNTSVKGKEDWIFWCSLARGGMSAAYIPFYGAIYRQHPGGMSKSEKEMGDCFLRATTIINDQGKDDLSFRLASRTWYDNFYAKRIEASRLTQNTMSASTDATSPLAHEVSRDVSGQLPRPGLPANVPTCGIALSVVIPVHNHYRDLVTCVNSIASQSKFQEVELIIVDDGSTEVGLKEYLTELPRIYSNIKLFSNHENCGISKTQNVAVAEASGEFIAFVDCDDYLADNALELILSEIKSHGRDVDYFFTDRYDVDEDGNILRLATYGGYDWISPSADIANDLLDGMVASHLKVIRRAQYISVGGSDPEFDGVQDWDLALRLLAKGARFLHVPKPLYNHRLHQKSVTRAQRVKQFKNSNRVRRRALCQKFRSTTSSNEIDMMDVLVGRVPYAEACPHIESINILKGKWLQGEVLIYKCKSDISVTDIAFLREFNSYYDLVIAESESAACALVGYMWDDRYLLYEGELGLAD